jgi:ATP-dependent protease ClpP protease subunit
MLKRKFYDIQYGYNSKKNKSTKKDDNSSTTSSNETDDLFNKLTSGGKKDMTKIERDFNHIYFYSEVDRDSIYDLVKLIQEAEEDVLLTNLKLKLKEELPIYIHISFYGGSVFAAYIAIDAIKSCKVPIHTIITGATASAGTLISICGKKRYITPLGNMLIHQLSSSFWGKMDEIEDEYKNLEDMMKKIKEIYIDHTNIPKKELSDLLKHDLWLNSDKCIKYGLVDEIWN